MAAREVSLSWSGKGETHWGLTRKIGPWKTTPQDKNFLQSGGEHAGHAAWFARFNPHPYQSTQPPTKEQRHRSGDVVYNTMEYEPSSHEKYVYGSSKRILMDRGLKDGIGRLGVKFVGPPSFSAVGSGTQIYNEGGHNQNIETRNAVLPRYTTRPTNMEYIDNLVPEHLKNRRVDLPNQQISAAAPFEVKIEKPISGNTSFEQLKEKVQNDAMIDNVSNIKYRPPTEPKDGPPDYEESEIANRKKFTRNAEFKKNTRYNPYSNVKRHVPEKRVTVSDAEILKSASKTMEKKPEKKPEKRKAFNQDGGGKKQRTGEAPTLKRKGGDQGGVSKKQRTGEAPTLKRKGGDQGGVSKKQKVGSSYLSGLGSKRKAEEQGGGGKKSKKDVLRINTRVAKIQGPKIGKRDKMPIPERRSTRKKV